MKKLNYSILILAVTLLFYALIEIIITLTIGKPKAGFLSPHMNKAILSLIGSTFLLNVWLLIKNKKKSTYK